LVEDIIPKVTEKAFNKFYEKQKNENKWSMETGWRPEQAF
jgi:hypothetical protein